MEYANSDPGSIGTLIMVIVMGVVFIGRLIWFFTHRDELAENLTKPSAVDALPATESGD